MSFTNLCVSVALGILQAMCMRHIVICSLSRHKNIAMFSHKWHNFRNKAIEYYMRVSVFSTTFVEIFSSLRRIERDMIKMCIGLHVKYRYFGPILMDLKFLYTKSKNTQITNFIKSLPEGADLFHTEGQTDRRNKADSRFSKFCERSLKSVS
jgi:hypothetical protein